MGIIFYFCPMKHLWIMIVIGCLMGCGTQKGGVTAVANHSGEALTPGEPHLLLLTGVITYDSLSATYDMDITHQEYADGYLNVDDTQDDLSQLHYVQLKEDYTILNSHGIENPLRRDLEYMGQTGYEHKVSILPRADFFFRLQLDKDARLVEFRYGETLIKQLSINF